MTKRTAPKAAPAAAVVTAAKRRPRKPLSDLLRETPPPPGRVLAAHEAMPAAMLTQAQIGGEAIVKLAAKAAEKRQPDLLKLAGRIIDSGWRRVFGWAGAALAVVIVAKVAAGEPIPSLEYLATPFAGLIAAIVARTVEKVQGVAG